MNDSWACMDSYYLRSDTQGDVRLYKLGDPSKRYWRPYTEAEQEEMRVRHRGGLGEHLVDHWIERGHFEDAAFLPENREQYSMGDLPHQWVNLYTQCRACFGGGDHECNGWVEFDLKFTDGVVRETAVTLAQD